MKMLRFASLMKTLTLMKTHVSVLIMVSLRSGLI